MIAIIFNLGAVSGLAVWLIIGLVILVFGLGIWEHTFHSPYGQSKDFHFNLGRFFVNITFFAVIIAVIGGCVKSLF